MNNGNACNHENNVLIAIHGTFRIVNSTPVHFAFNAAIVVLCIAKKMLCSTGDMIGWFKKKGMYYRKRVEDRKVQNENNDGDGKIRIHASLQCNPHFLVFGSVFRTKYSQILTPYRTDAILVVLVRLPFLGCKAKVVAGFKTRAPLRDLRGFVIFFSTLYI